jgi:hypothetical protein
MGRDRERQRRTKPEAREHGFALPRFLADDREKGEQSRTYSWGHVLSSEMRDLRWKTCFGHDRFLKLDFSACEKLRVKKI